MAHLRHGFAYKSRYPSATDYHNQPPCHSFSRLEVNSWNKLYKKVKNIWEWSGYKDYSTIHISVPISKRYIVITSAGGGALLEREKYNVAFMTT